MKSFRVLDRTIGADAPPFVIAEMSGNHNQSLERALAIVDAAADAGCHALKIQTYTADTMTLDIGVGEFFIADEKSLWNGSSLHALYNQAFTPWEWHTPIFERARHRGMVPFSTPFDSSAVEFLESLDAPMYKIASFENTDLPLIKRVARTGKPMIVSTGMASVAELEQLVRAAYEGGCEQLVLLKCTSAYPTPPEEVNLRTIPHLRELFGTQVGLSDHTMGVGVSLASVAMGATVIEKHFTLARADGGVDSAFSMEPDEMRMLVAESEKAWRALGTVHYGTTDSDARSVKHRRSLYVAVDMKEGDVFTSQSLRAIRPGLGLAPGFYEQLLGKSVRRDVTRGTPVTWDLVL
jgi:pseudaminic acid synthase